MSDDDQRKLCGRPNPDDADPRHTCGVAADEAHNVCNWGGLRYWWNEGGEQRFQDGLAAARAREAART